MQSEIIRERQKNELKNLLYTKRGLYENRTFIQLSIVIFLVLDDLSVEHTLDQEIVTGKS